MAKKSRSKATVKSSSGQSSKGEILVYQTEDGKIKLDVRLERETLWMAQSDMAQLFQCSVDNISQHLKNIYEERELTEEATTEDFSVVRREGARQVHRKLTFYNLDVVGLKCENEKTCGKMYAINSSKPFH